jgi:hypothetical protein
MIHTNSFIQNYIFYTCLKTILSIHGVRACFFPLVLELKLVERLNFSLLYLDLETKVN